MATVGEAVIKLTFDNSGIKAGVATTEKQVEGMGAKIGKSAENIGKVLAAGFATATASAIAFSKASIDAFNEEERIILDLLKKYAFGVVQPPKHKLKYHNFLY